MKKSKTIERFITRTLSPDLEFCFILDAQNGYSISDLVLLTSYWKLVKYARDVELALSKGDVSEETKDKMLHHFIGVFIECVHTYDPDKHRVSFLEFVASKLFQNAATKGSKKRKGVNKRVTEAIALMSQVERSIDESYDDDKSRTLVESICGNLPDQESLLHKKMLANTFSEKIFASLTKSESEVIRGVYYQDLTDREVASQLGKPVSKIRSIERKALRKIRYEITKQRLFDELNADVS